MTIGITVALAGCVALSLAQEAKHVPLMGTITLKGGDALPFDKLLLAAGAHPFVPPFPGANREGVTTLRTVEDADRILDASRQIAGLLQLPLQIPLEVYRLMLSLAERGVKTCGRVLRATDALDTAIRSGLTGPDVSGIYRLVDEVRHSNNDARVLVDDLRATLHEQCKDRDAVSLVFMLELTRLLGELSRHAEHAACRALLLVSR